MVVGKFYYYSDQFGCRFIKITQITDIWVKFYKCPSLNHIINHSNKFFSHEIGKFICEPSQCKKWMFDKLLNNFTFEKSSKSQFRGCFEIDDKIVNSISNGVIPNIDNDHLLTFENDIIPKVISEDNFRNLKINMVLD